MRDLNLTKSLSDLAALPILFYQNLTQDARRDSPCSDRSLAWEDEMKLIVRLVTVCADDG
jgi:hypothetical protein